MTVAMMQVRVMRVLVPQRLVAVPMGMRLGHRTVVGVLMMLIVDMGMIVFEHLMEMFMLMTLSEMQP